MKSDIDGLMQENDLEALWVSGSADHNPNMVYFTGLHHISNAILMKKRNRPPVLFYNSMERDEASKTGLEMHNLLIYPDPQRLKKCQGNYIKAYTEVYHDLLKDMKISSGKISISGHVDAGTSYILMTALQKAIPKIEIAGMLHSDILRIARMTKDTNEIDHIRKVGKFTTDVVAMTADFLSHQNEKESVLVDKDGKPITVADIKQQLRLWLTQRDLETPEEIIFAIGRDAGVPHSAGNPSDVIRTGIPIVFDIFPCEAGGGYFFDFTRTWCVGYAPDAVLKLYEQVYEVYQTLISELKDNVPFSNVQDRACELFSRLGHATIADQPGLEEGYVHSIGHGLGLAVHEKPFAGVDASPMDILKPGVVFTLEPGLYYPSKNIGVRLEDTFACINPGKFEVLAHYPLDIVIPLKKK
jgi:Xaa-Pro aminopeptidase